MEKINFEDGQLVKQATVTIDGVEHQVTPAQCTGNTPCSAFVLNKLQDNIENAINAMKMEILKAENPIGKIRMETTDTNPATFLGFGTWELWGSGKVPVGVNADDTDFATVEKTGGEKTHTLSVDEMPSHTHPQDPHIHDEIVDNNGYRITYATGSTANFRVMNQLKQGDASGSWKMLTSSATATNQNTGGNQSHNNLPPYITCYMWKRTA